MKPTWLPRFLLITFTVLTSLLLGVIVFLARESLLVLTIMLSTNAYLPRALDKFYLVTLGLVWLMGWFVFEGYMNIGINQHNLLARFMRVLGWELVALFLCGILAYLFTEAGVHWTAVGLLAAALVAGIALLLVSRGMFAAPKRAPLEPAAKEESA